MNKYLSRVLKSERGENFNPLIWPFIIATLSYGIGFALFSSTGAVGKSSLFAAMTSMHTVIPVIWGVIAILTILIGITFLLFKIPPIGKASGLVGFMIWVFATFCWLIDGNILLAFSVGIPNMWFWIWQYLSLSVFRSEDKADKETMQAYHRGEYDDGNGGRALRETNRGVDTDDATPYH